MLHHGKTVAAVLAVLLAAQLPALALYVMLHPGSAPTPTADVSNAIPPLRLDSVSDDVLWMARCAYSETKRADEQRLVAWVIRNRVETGYRGQRSYETVVTDPYQFSAFNPGNPKRVLYSSLTPTSDAAGWRQALEAAHAVYYSDASERPFSDRTRHFYSERSMPGRRAPRWASGHQPVQPVGFRVDPSRFRFYAGVAAMLKM